MRGGSQDSAPALGIFHKKQTNLNKRGQEWHNEIRDFYAHVALAHERRFARCFCRDSGNTAQRYFLQDNQKENTIPYGNLVFSFFAFLLLPQALRGQ